MGQQFIQGALEALLGVLADLGGNGVGRAGKGGDLVWLNDCSTSPVSGLLKYRLSVNGR